MQRQGLGSSGNGIKGLGLREKMVSNWVSLCLCPSLSPPPSLLSEVLELEPRTLPHVKELALHLSIVHLQPWFCQHLTWASWGKSVEFWILISNRDQKHPTCRAGDGYYKWQWLISRDPAFLSFSHIAFTKEMSESVLLKAPSIYRVLEFAGWTGNWGLLSSACAFDNLPVGIHI